MEDALGRLDRLTQEEVRMAAAEGLKAIHKVDSKVQAVDNKVEGVNVKIQDVGGKVHGVDDRVQDVGNKVQGVDDRIQGVDDRVQCVDDKVRAVDDKVQAVDDRVRDIDDKVDIVVDSAQFFSTSHPHPSNFSFSLGGDKIREEIRQVADDIDDQKRS